MSVFAGAAPAKRRNGETAPAASPKKAEKAQPGASFTDSPFAAKYKRMKTAELNALLEERGIEVPDTVTNNLQRVALLVQADEAEAAKAAEAETEE